MDSLKELYKIGNGPSSSHTMGPQKAAQIFKERNKKVKAFRVTLYGSLAATGRGHLTDWIILETLKPYECEIIWKPEIIKEFHTNGMLFESLEENGEVIEAWEVFSVGGGAIMEASEKRAGKSQCH